MRYSGGQFRFAIDFTKTSGSSTERLHAKRRRLHSVVCPQAREPSSIARYILKGSRRRRRGEVHSFGARQRSSGGHSPVTNGICRSTASRELPRLSAGQSHQSSVGRTNGEVRLRGSLSIVKAVRSGHPCEFGGKPTRRGWQRLVKANRVEADRQHSFLRSLSWRLCRLCPSTISGRTLVAFRAVPSPKVYVVQTPTTGNSTLHPDDH